MIRIDFYKFFAKNAKLFLKKYVVLSLLINIISG